MRKYQEKLQSVENLLLDNIWKLLIARKQISGITYSVSLDVINELLAHERKNNGPVRLRNQPGAYTFVLSKSVQTYNDYTSDHISVDEARDIIIKLIRAGKDITTNKIKLE